MRWGRQSEPFTIRVRSEKLAGLRDRLGDRRSRWIRNGRNHAWVYRSGLVKVRAGGSSYQLGAHFKGRLVPRQTPVVADQAAAPSGPWSGADLMLTGTIRESFNALLWTWIYALPAVFTLLLGLAWLLGDWFSHPGSYLVLAFSGFLFWFAGRMGRDRPTTFAMDAADVKDELRELVGRS